MCSFICQITFMLHNSPTCERCKVLDRQIMHPQRKVMISRCHFLSSIRKYGQALCRAEPCGRRLPQSGGKEGYEAELLYQADSGNLASSPSSCAEATERVKQVKGSWRTKQKTRATIHQPRKSTLTRETGVSFPALVSHSCMSSTRSGAAFVALIYICIH